MIYDAPKYPNMPGHRGVETSIAAATAVAGKLGRLQKLTLDTIKTAGFHGCTTDEAANALAIDRGTIQPRTSELKLRGLIVDSSQRRRNANGKRAIVWVAADTQGKLSGGEA
jgi:hypothetical protein